MILNSASVSTLELVQSLEEYWFKRPTDFIGSNEKTSDVISDPYSVFIKSYQPVLNGTISWLPKIEAAIKSSVPEELIEEENRGQWLDADAAYNAIHFLQNTADLLPGEPRIYGTPLGDFVAEFESPLARLTSIISAQRALLISFCRANPKEQLQIIIPRESSRIRDEVREFNKKLAAVHGEALGPAR